ncbi:MAG: phosphodiester glycosidase family protein [Thermoproteota archaeon]|nr:phosphodiester glycosidase family protein [Candidatus Brockarchaeota archaeon]MBO3768230.1 phosphodiester glycosidase family protein [Candidatus Brockarchaeota archaeon]MBO3801252.1 phosphodiester glycosidase family protein [Candidatus Brockarchaeota archaeon]
MVSYKRRTFESEFGKRVVHVVEISFSELKRLEIKPLQAKVPEKKEELIQVAHSLRRIATADKIGIRGLESKDNVLVISKEDKNTFIEEGSHRIILSKDLYGIEIVKKFIKGKKLVYDHKKDDFKLMNTMLQEDALLKELKDKMIYFSESQEKEQIVEPTLPITLCSGYENLMEMVKRNNAIAGINGGYFLNFPEEISKYDAFNDPVGLIMIDKHIINPPIFRRGTILLSEEGVYLDTLSVLDLTIKIGKTKFSFKENSSEIKVKLNSENEVSLYTLSYARNLSEDGIKFVVVGRNLVEITEEKEVEVPRNGFIILVKDKNLARRIISETKETKISSIVYGIEKLEGERVVHGLSAGPILLKDGKEVKYEEEFKEGIPPSRIKFNIRAPRSVFATSEDKILLITVDDDRQTKLNPEERYSVGATLDELITILKEIGCKNAINLDGGGSSTLILNNEVKNRPSDGFLRAISTALIVTQKVCHSN